MASRTAIVQPGFHKLSKGPSAYLGEPEVSHEIRQVSHSQQAEKPTYRPHATVARVTPVSYMVPNLYA